MFSPVRTVSHLLNICTITEGLTDGERLQMAADGEREVDDMVRYNPYNWNNNDTIIRAVWRPETLSWERR